MRRESDDIGPLAELHFWEQRNIQFNSILEQVKSRRSTMVENSQEYRLKYWATHSSVRSFARSFARTAHSWDGE